ncbi:hypothetical protein CsatB_030693 [Cannabis sativa]
MALQQQVLTHQDLLVEIFIKLNDITSIIRCKSVCKIWFSTLNSTYYRHKKLFYDYQSTDNTPFTFILKYDNVSKLAEPYYEYFSNESQILHHNNTTNHHYLDFLPYTYLRILATCDDLVLISRDRTLKYLLICNPFTKQWIELPPIQAELPNLCIRRGGLIIDHGRHHHHQIINKIRYKVMVIWPHDYNNTTRTTHCCVITFCSDNEKWSTDQPYLFSIPWIDFNFNSPVSYNGNLYFLLNHYNKDYISKIISFNLFNYDHTMLAHDIVKFPLSFNKGKHFCYDSMVRLGLAKGRLRLSQNNLVANSNDISLKIWELDDATNDWSLVHDINIRTTWRNRLKYMLDFHPNNPNVVFLLYKSYHLYEYDIVEDKFHKVAEFPSSTPVYNHPLLHPFWPTHIPALRVSFATTNTYGGCSTR